MAAILTAAEMRARERAAIDSGAVTGLELMERAGRGVVAAMLDRWPDAGEASGRALALCGPGHNGGDGFVVARLLAERGWTVEAWLLGEEAALPPDAARALAAWRGHGPVGRLTLPVGRDLHDEVAWRPEDDRRPLHVIDALFGVGLRRPIGAAGAGGDLASFLTTLREEAHEGGPEMRGVAIDLPSGLCADSGRVLRPAGDGREDRDLAFNADLTVTFHAMKPGHLLSDGPGLCGRLVVADIGLGRLGGLAIRDAEPPGYTLAKHDAHKYVHGHAVVLGGGCGRGGAARLAARGALRIGAGLVTLAVPPAALQENAARLDAVMLRPVRDAPALSALLADDRVRALCAGPGLGVGEREAALLAALLDASQGGRGVVLDADALTLLSRDEALRARLHDGCVLTPHEGEFARLFPEIDARWTAPATTGPAFSKVDAAREAAGAAGCTVLLKGPDTVIAEPTGRAAINAAVRERRAPWLATAGSGDVLAGFIAGLLARGLAPFDAACTAAWLHVECARSFGPGLIAEDLPEELPRVFRALGL